MSHSLRTGWVNASAPSGLSHAQKRLSSCTCGEPMGATRLGFARARRQFVCAIFIWGLKALGFARAQANSFAQFHCCVQCSRVRSCTVRIRLCGLGSRVHGSRVQTCTRQRLDTADMGFGGADSWVPGHPGVAVGFAPLVGGWVRSCQGANSFVQFRTRIQSPPPARRLGSGVQARCGRQSCRRMRRSRIPGLETWVGGIGGGLGDADDPARG